MRQDLDWCYEALEIKPGATLAEVKTAFRDLAQVWHPDRYTHNSRLQQKAQERFKAINEAYQALCNHLGRDQFSEREAELQRREERLMQAEANLRRREEDLRRREEDFARRSSGRKPDPQPKQERHGNEGEPRRHEARSIKGRCPSCGWGVSAGWQWGHCQSCSKALPDDLAGAYK